MVIIAHTPRILLLVTYRFDVAPGKRSRVNQSPQPSMLGRDSTIKPPMHAAEQITC